MGRTIALAVICISSLTSATWAQGRRQATLAQQKMCADQAKSYFKDAKRDILDVESTPKETLVVPPSYVDHYDAKANVCYIGILWGMSSDGGQTITMSTSVYDAFEGTSYATYIWTSDKAKKHWQVKPTWCAVEPRGQAEVTCKSEDEFNELVQKYFGLVLR